MLRTRYLIVGLVLAVLLAAVGGMGFVVGQSSPATDENATDSSTSGDDTGSMMGSMMNGGA
jgi:Na+-transporting methylmalonyl-CoA/oxaloacetate decarboxylase gamma subunit